MPSASRHESHQRQCYNRESSNACDGQESQALGSYDGRPAQRPLRAPSRRNRGVSLIVVDLTGTIPLVELRRAFAVLTAAVRVSMSS